MTGAGHEPKTLVLERIVAELATYCPACGTVTVQAYAGMQELLNLGMYMGHAGVWYQCPAPCNSSHLYLVRDAGEGKGGA